MTKTGNPSLEESLLTMDIVDKIRHEEALLDEYANDEERAQKLKEHLANVYRQQGIDVSDDVLEEGVKASMEGRFVHKPVTKGFAVKLANIYIQRGRWGKQLAALLAALGIGSGAYYGTVMLPEQQNRATAIVKTNTGLRNLSETRTLLLQRAQRLLQGLQQPMAATDASRSLLESLESEAKSLVVKSESALTHLQLPDNKPISEADYDTRYSSLNRAVTEAQDALTQAEVDIIEAERLLNNRGRVSDLATQLNALGVRLSNERLNSQFKIRMEAYQTQAQDALRKGDIPLAEQHIMALSGGLDNYPALMSVNQEAQRVLDEAKRTSKEPLVDDELALYYSKVLAGVDAGSLQKARSAMQELQQLAALVKLDLKLKIVNRSGVKSGVWRISNANANAARNYYLVVEALDRSGKSVDLPITNEESQNTNWVNLFAVRVTQRDFERVKADKLDNGIIDSALIGEKAPGYITLNWRINKVGGYITQW